jgi:hypothetical protein
MKARIAVTLSLLLAAGGCGPRAGDYFPLDPGRSWDYRVTVAIRGETREQRLLLGSVAPTTVDGTVYHPRRRLDGRLEFHERAADGVLSVDPVSGRKALVLPPTPQSGAKWQGSTHIFFLEVTGVFTPTFEARVQQSIPVEFVVEAENDTVTVGAGTFENCLRVRSAGSLFAGSTLKDFMGIRFIKVEQTDWYAPGVGLIKRVRNEYTTPADWNNEYVQELVGFEG